MMHVSTSALCLVFLSSTVMGFPTSSSIRNTSALIASTEERTSSTDPVTVTTKLPVANSGNNKKRSFSNSPSATPVSTSTSSHPVVDSGDRTRVEYEKSNGALKYFQTLLVNVLQPQPIVDTIREEDKYGNEGEKLGQVGRSIVGGVAKLTNFISSALDLPYEVLKSFTRNATETLNNIGGKLVGI